MVENGPNSRPQPTRRLLILALVFIAGAACTQCLRFTHPVPNELFGAAVLSVPFLALRPLSQLPRIPKIIGRIAVVPFLLFSLLTALTFVACGDLQLHRDRQSCMEELGKVDQPGYSVQLVRDGCGGAAVSFMLLVQQRMPLFPGLYVIRSVDILDDTYEGNLTAVAPDRIRLQVEGSSWHQQIDRVYQLKRHVYF